MANGLRLSLGARLSPQVRPPLIALGYLAALAVAESIATLVEPRVGLVMYGALLLLLLFHAARNWEHPTHRLLLALAFAPLIRLLSFALPLTHFPQIYWYLITSVPLFVAAFLAARTLRFSPRELGLNLRGIPLQLVIGLTGLTFGYIEYQILAPAPLAKGFTWGQIWLPALILLISTGLLEELIFRGLLQRSATETLGRYAVLYVAILFAVLHFGYKSLVDVVFVLGVGLFFGWIVARTGSIVGVTLAHGLTNITLFLVMPFLFVAVPQRAAPVADRPIPAIAAPAASGLEPAVAANATFTVTVQSSAAVAPLGSPTVMPSPAAPPKAVATAVVAPPTVGGTAVVALLQAGAAPRAVAPPTVGVTAVATAEATAVVAVNSLNVRAGPSTEGAIFAAATRGQAYAISGRNRAGDWWQIRYRDGMTGWVFGALVTTEGDLGTVPLIP